MPETGNRDFGKKEDTHASSSSEEKIRIVLDGLRGESMDEREVKDTYPVTDIFQVVTEELGVEVTTEEWQEMGFKC